MMPLNNLIIIHKKAGELKNNFEQQFGPLMGFGASYSDYPFNWGNTPWPWQV